MDFIVYTTQFTWSECTMCRLVIHRLYIQSVGAVQVWCTKSMSYYAEQTLAGVTLPKPYDDIDDDPHQVMVFFQP